ncbi:serine threonine [Chlorella sorokiniana]|uniref:Serine threonine n=1 Tax=Chlorella sorokiniana TaxID=3076 RepID=A0A2P6TV93_CHLSO|nr:serine threonine [Chlorella sorokiniana]|eukprot:PRW57987.1 serine threonine [Chlorella sorokiniana]
MNTVGGCEACQVANCSSCWDHASKCTTAMEGYRLTTTGTEACTVAHCLSCPDSANTCQSCEPRYALDNKANSCFACPDNCDYCDRPNACLTCAHSSYRLPSGNNCAKCQANDTALPVKVELMSTDAAAPMLRAQADKIEYARSLSHCLNGCIAAVHPDQAVAALSAPGAFPALGGRSCTVSARLTGAWAALQQPAPCATAAADADDVQPKQPAAPTAQPYVPPALRPGAGAATLAGCPMPRCAAPVPTSPPAPYVQPYRRTAEQQAAAAAPAAPAPS